MRPPYTYVPGKKPHPTRDPAGHSYGSPERSCVAPDPLNPGACPAFQEGLDLFRAGYYWEAHEAWEAVWNAAGRRGAVADFLKGLIKLAAAGVKVYEGLPEGVRRHATRARELFEETRGELGETPFGLSVSALVSLCDHLVESPPAKPAEPAGQPVALWRLEG